MKRGEIYFQQRPVITTYMHFATDELFYKLKIFSIEIVFSFL